MNKEETEETENSLGERREGNGPPFCCDAAFEHEYEHEYEHEHEHE